MSFDLVLFGGTGDLAWRKLVPTIREEGSEIWVTFNPDMDTDDTYKRWVEHPPPGTKIVKMGWQDAQAHGWFPERENEKRLKAKLVAIRKLIAGEKVSR